MQQKHQDVNAEFVEIVLEEIKENTGVMNMGTASTRDTQAMLASTRDNLLAFKDQLRVNQPQSPTRW